jgi:uncharacterized cupredoxin-like copper-binding protein
MKANHSINMNANTLRLVLLLAACVIGAGCRQQTAAKESTPFRIVATDTGFAAADRVPAGLRHVVFENSGSEIHEAMLVKLPLNMRPDDYVAAVRHGMLFPKGALDYSGPGLTSPGEKAEMWLKLDPGQYIIICWNDGHATRSVHPFTVDSPGIDDPVPKEEVVIRLLDYRFEVEGNLRKGTRVIRIETPGPNMHEVDMYRLHEGKTAADLHSWRKDDGSGAAPADALGGALDSHDIARVVWLRKDFRPGRYVLHCEMPLTTDATASTKNITHGDLGMIKEFEIE